jgi:hypothetical protein
MEIIRISILILQHLIEHNLNIKDSDDIQDHDHYLFNITKDFYSQFLDLQNSQKNQKKAIDLLTDNFLKQEQTYEKITKQLQDAILKYPQIKYHNSNDISIAKPSLQSNNSITDLLNKIKERRTRAKLKDMLDWGFSDPFIRQHGGVKKINETALADIIDDIDNEPVAKIITIPQIED